MIDLFGNPILPKYDSHEPRSERNLETEILSLLKDKPSGMKFVDIGKALGVSKASLGPCLKVMESTGKVFLNGNMHWRLPSFILKKGQNKKDEGGKNG